MARTKLAEKEKRELDECPELTPEQMRIQKEILYGLGKVGKEGRKRALVSNYDTYFVVARGVRNSDNW